MISYVSNENSLTKILRDQAECIIADIKMEDTVLFGESKQFRFVFCFCFLNSVRLI